MVLMKNITYSSTKFGKFLNLFGFTIAINSFGNCFWPALVIDWRGVQKSWVSSKGVRLYPAFLIITFRSGPSMETAFYWRGWFRFDWNSGHLARHFGKRLECSFGDIYVWGKHVN